MWLVQSMANVFRMMEQHRTDLGIEEYNLSMPTLEQAFHTVVGQHLQGLQFED